MYGLTLFPDTARNLWKTASISSFVGWEFIARITRNFSPKIIIGFSTTFNQLVEMTLVVSCIWQFWQTFSKSSKHSTGTCTGNKNRCSVMKHRIERNLFCEHPMRCCQMFKQYSVDRIRILNKYYLNYILWKSLLF